MTKTESNAKRDLIISMVMFGTIGVFRKYISYSSVTLAMLRGIIGGAFLIVFINLTKKDFDKKTVKDNLVWLIASGLMIAINWILLFEAYRFTSVAVATLMYYMEPVIISIASRFLFNEKIPSKKLVCIFAALLGMTLVSGLFDTKETMVSFKGVFLGLGAAVFYSIVVLINKKLGKVDSYDKTIVQLISAGIAMIPYFFIASGLSDLKTDTLSLILTLIVCIVHTGLCYALYFGSIGNLKASTLAIFSYIDPIVAVLLSWIVLGEKMTISIAIGAVLIIGSAIISELK